MLFCSSQVWGVFIWVTEDRPVRSDQYRHSFLTALISKTFLPAEPFCVNSKGMFVHDKNAQASLSDNNKYAMFQRSLFFPFFFFYFLPFRCLCQDYQKLVTCTCMILCSVPSPHAWLIGYLHNWGCPGN